MVWWCARMYNSPVHGVCFELTNLDKFTWDKKVS